MTIADRVHTMAGSVPPVAGSLPASPVRLRFVGNRRDYWRLMIRGGALQAITLGIYRFWLFTDMRRFLWASTEVAGETLEYTGTALELLLGFLMAIAILIPVYVLFFVASLELGILSRLSGIVAFIVLAGFGQYAAFRARRYRLTRTVFRGLRFHQEGSAVRYALQAMLWWIPIVLSLGLALPWATVNLERYKMRNTFYGNLRGSFAGSGWRLFGHGILIWLLLIGPVVGGLVAVQELVDLSAGGADLASMIGGMDGISLARLGIWLAVAGTAWLLFIGFILIPAYQAITMRWWLGGLRLGGAAAASDLRIRRYWGAYLRYLLYVVLFSIVYFIVVGTIASQFGLLAFHGQIDFNKASLLRDGLAAGSAIAAYVFYILVCSTIYQVVVKMRLWQVAVESTMISGLAAFDHVQATEATSSAVGEGLADALGAAGI
jgi:uncharacterized membrane protein YjgN (DUF898 family)